MTEASTLTNFNCGFSTHKSDILIHLSQWQYWWWFWFSFFWSMYFFVILYMVNKRTMQFNPIINTSIRGHGKWGDFLVALIPLSWCGNILVNSNFILRMIEWQNEGSLFTLRVQGKQWYWVYKFDATTVQNILAAPKNIGNNNWLYTTNSESYTGDTYNTSIHMGAQLEHKEMYFKLLKDDELTRETVNSWNNKLNSEKFIDTQVNDIKLPDNIGDFLAINFLNLTNEYSAAKWMYIEKYIKNVLAGDHDAVRKLILEKDNQPDPLLAEYELKNSVRKFFLSILDHKQIDLNNLNEPTLKFLTQFYDNQKLDDTSKFASNLIVSTKNKPLQIINGVLNKHNLNILQNADDSFDKSILYVAKFWLNNGRVEPKVDDSELLWGFKQKKYKRLQNFKFKDKVEYDHITLNPIAPSKKINGFTLKSNLTSDSLANNFSYQSDDQNTFDYHNSVKFNRHRSELVPVNLARRLLRTKRTLVLPAHVNITVITNSYDVVHSWFIPGLGLKLDCVPGRSTHHSFYIDNIGFYYGQCAEICGRYHHHMPIRICALPFEQFLVWWKHRGLKRMHRIRIINHDKKLVNTKDIAFRYKW